MMNGNSLIASLREDVKKKIGQDLDILTECDSDTNIAAYEKSRQIFNTKFQFHPQAIIFVSSTEQVSAIVCFVNKHPGQINLRVRSGGHDHEGECSASDAWQIDFRKMNKVILSEKTEKHNTVTVEPGAIFRKIKCALDDRGWGIAHGTCGTVGVTGYTLGGGWGPWTRRYGMGCERLIGATIVLGDGKIINVNDKDKSHTQEGELLWALRGGGGFSYGIVTKLIFEPFVLPANLLSFSVRFAGVDGKPNRPTVEILKAWEELIADGRHPQLIGTNLKIKATHLPPGKSPDPGARLDTTLYGYFDGSEEDIAKLVTDNFGNDCEVNVDLPVQVSSDEEDEKKETKANLFYKSFEAWDRISLTPNENGIQLEGSGPAPHKITSRLADSFAKDWKWEWKWNFFLNLFLFWRGSRCKGWGAHSRKALVNTLQSSLVIPDEGKGPFGVQQYITILAIAGPFYQHYKQVGIGCAFPYRDRPFFLQFQAWWNQFLDSKGNPVMDQAQDDMQDIINQAIVENRMRSNIAEDWIEACRDADIPGSGGAFISFKDDAVKTSQYFAENFKKLCNIKAKYSQDNNHLFSTRKTVFYEKE